jgi:TonB family protein
MDDFGFFKSLRMATALLQREYQFYFQGGIVSLRRVGAVVVVLALSSGTGTTRLGAQTTQSDAQGEISRKVKSRVPATYPELARKMNITGTVKVEVVVSPNGSVKEAKIVGGHPVLATAALDAVKKWRFEPAAVESSGVVDFKFESHQ